MGIVSGTSGGTSTSIGTTAAFGEATLPDDGIVSTIEGIVSTIEGIVSTIEGIVSAIEGIAS